MEVIKTKISDLLIIKPNVFYDERGYFFESYNEKKFAKIGIKYLFIQDNQSFSQKGVLRGLHFQAHPFAQGKLIRVINGSVLDVAVDIRKNSISYGKYFSQLLSSENKLMFWVPPGFAHGFLTLEDNTILSYKCTQIYNKESEKTILWNDPELNIDWGIDEPVISEKDKNAANFKELTVSF